jgi:transposase
VVRPYSLDLRVRVVAAVDGGQSCRAVAELFDVSVASVMKWSQRARMTGSAAAKPMGGKRPVFLAGQRAFILERIEAVPNLALRTLAAELAERGVVVSYGAVWTFVHREGLSFKKSVLPAEQDRPDVARRRARWKRHQKRIDPRRLVFIDETWTKTNMAPLRGWN